MPRRPQIEPLGSETLQEVYGPGYFHGANSGFSEQGYARVHATWLHWMPALRGWAGSGARLLDLGCAYGFLVEEARSAGFEAFGLDGSHFALAQAAGTAPAAAGRLLGGRAECLPFADGSVDVVTAFDLVEHLPDPRLLVREVARVLRPGGFFVAATPDPLLFDREEPTHLSEHVPSWWVHELEAAGFEVSLRFFQAEYNCEWVACLGAPAPEISFDALAPDPVLHLRGDPALRVAPRRGFGPVEDDGARVVEQGAAVYLLNVGRDPLRVRVRFQTDEPHDLRLSLDGQDLEVRKEAGVMNASRFLLPRGGHRLEIGPGTEWVRLRRLEMEAEACDPAHLREILPFDLHDRYALAADVLGRIGVRDGPLLDVGGTMGGEQGHLAWTGDFLRGHEVTVIDGRAADYPEHMARPVDERLPFEDGAFATVLSQDVLEHVPPTAREAWLEEVWRVTGRYLLLTCPWNTPGVAEADRSLFVRIAADHGYEHGFLSEHLEYGHPDLEATRRFFEERGATCVTLPSGHLGTWSAMQAVNARLSHPRQGGDYRRANRALNLQFAPGETGAPAYRHLLVVDRRAELRPGDLPVDVVPPPDLECVLDSVSDRTFVRPRQWQTWTGRVRGVEEWPPVALALVSCEGRALLEKCLASLAGIDYPRELLETLVYDNGSTDGTAAWLARRHPEVRVIEAGSNEGFAAPCNRLAEATAASRVCFVNNDVEVEPDFLRRLVEAARDTDAACVGARILSSDGETIEFDGGSMNFIGHGAPLRGGARASDHAGDYVPFETLFASGATMLVDREVFCEVGGFDESYFAYFEDVDLGWRLWTLGERCVQAPAARVRHLEHGSEALLPPRRRLALLERNALLTIAKNYEGERAQRVLRCALALAAERESMAEDPDRREACREGLLAATAILPAAERRGEELRRRRSRSDAEIARLFVEPWRPPIGGPDYARRQVEAARLFGAADLFADPPAPGGLA